MRIEEDDLDAFRRNFNAVKAEAAPDYVGNTLHALHHALISLHALAYEGTEPRTIGRMLDDIEYLGILAMQSRTDDSPEHVEDFRLHLQDLEAKYPGFGHLTAAFDGWQGKATSG